VKIRPQSVTEIESLLTGLLGVVSAVKAGDRRELEEGVFGYAHQVVASAETPLRKLGMYEATAHAVNESERLLRSEQFDEADDLLLALTRGMMEKSGTTARLERIFGPPTSKKPS
jgi:hypothetical protein